MNRIIFLVLLGMIFSCDDGDLQIETVDFDAAAIEFCETETDINSTVFFKLNQDEALILELQSGVLRNETSNGTITSSVPNQSKITYRIFSDNVSKGYFCDEIPPSEPTVIEEIQAEGGNVFLTTVQSENDTTLYEHTIELSGISLVNTTGERITDLRINDFGTITTRVQEDN